MELIDIYDELNNDLGYSVDRKKAHSDNLWHRYASTWIMNDKGEILLQQRSKNKKKNPLLWGKTGGHVGHLETPLEAVKRETLEELGLKLNDRDIKLLDVYKSNSNEHYFSYGYIAFTNNKIEDFVLQKEEVEKVKYYKIEELEKYKENNSKDFTFYKWSNDSFKEQMDKLKKYRDIQKNN